MLTGSNLVVTHAENRRSIRDALQLMIHKRDCNLRFERECKI